MGNQVPSSGQVYLEPEASEMAREMTQSLDLTAQDRRKLFLRGYKVGSSLGSGSFGTVYRGTWGYESTVDVAVKTILPKSDNMSFVHTELSVIKRVKHCNIVPIHDIYVSSNNVILVIMELGEGGDLESLVWKSRPVAALSEHKSRLFYKQFGAAISYLHGLGVAHLDIKSANIILDRAKNVCKVTDFGLAMLSYNEATGASRLAKCYRGSVPYVSPEMSMCWFDAIRFCPLKADVWSTGVLLYEILNRAYPFTHKRLDTASGKCLSDYEWMYDTQMARSFRFVNGSLSQHARSIVTRHFEPDPKIRKSIGQIMETEPWLNVD